MKKADLVKLLKEDVDVTTLQAEQLLESLGKIVEKAVLGGGDVVVIPGLGRFVKQTRNARIGLNPKTGVKVEIPAKAKVVFKMSATLK